MNMPTELSRVLERWEREFAAGQDLSPEELCRDQPSMLPEVRRQIQALKAMRWVERSQSAQLEPTRVVANTTPAVLVQGSEVGAGFRLVRQRGQGGFGEVWEAIGPGGFSAALKIGRA